MNRSKSFNKAKLQNNASFSFKYICLFFRIDEVKVIYVIQTMKWMKNIQ